MFNILVYWFYHSYNLDDVLIEWFFFWVWMIFFSFFTHLVIFYLIPDMNCMLLCCRFVIVVVCITLNIWNQFDSFEVDFNFLTVDPIIYSLYFAILLSPYLSENSILLVLDHLSFYDKNGILYWRLIEKQMILHMLHVLPHLILKTIS